ncbi:MAG: cell division protein ZapA [Beijerinckiaceae bacterium]|nr:cell division protein ZapA [Beijerinckiaceae bacterium]
MAQLSVTIAGRTYRLACDEGEEARLGDLAQLVDAKIAGIRQRFGAIGDQRLVMMAAITLADECAEANGRVRELEAEIAKFKVAPDAAPEWAGLLADSLGEAAQRIERVAQGLSDSSRA